MRCWFIHFQSHSDNYIACTKTHRRTQFSFKFARKLVSEELKHCDAASQTHTIFTSMLMLMLLLFLCFTNIFLISTHRLRWCERFQIDIPIKSTIELGLWFNSFYSLVFGLIFPFSFILYVGVIFHLRPWCVFVNAAHRTRTFHIALVETVIAKKRGKKLD